MIINRIDVTDPTNITTFTIPSGYTEIGRGAFENCINLTEIRGIEHVKKIGDDAFKNCDAF